MADAVTEIARRLARLEEAVRKLGTAARAPYTSIRGGGIRFLAAADPNPNLYAGDLVGDGDVGIWVTDENEVEAMFIGTSSGVAGVVAQPESFIDARNPDGDGRALYINAGKVMAPLTSCAWEPDTNTAVDTGGRPTFTSASYVATHRTVLPVTSGAVRTWIDVYPGAGNTVDVKIEVMQFNTGSTYLIHEQTGITSTTLIADTWTVPAFDSGLGPIGFPGLFTISARRTAGASTAALAPRIPLVNWPT